MDETANQESGSDPRGGTPPGSDAAVEQGCTCPVIDNQHCAGGCEFAGEMQWWIAEECPLHGFTLTEMEPQEDRSDD